MFHSLSTQIFCVVIVCFCSHAVLAQEAPEFPGPEKEHEFLKKFVGDWTTTSEATMAPGQEPMKCTGKITGKMLGGLWVVNETKMTVMGEEMNALQTVGFDPAKKQYVGTWVDSALNHMWHYTGTVEGKTLTLNAEGPNFMAGGKMTKFRDIYEFVSEDEMKVSSQMQGDDGKWITFMSGASKRVKK